MSRAKLILAPVLPALWLIVLLGSFAEPGVSRYTAPTGPFLVARGDYRHDTYQTDGAAQRAARRWSRRLNIQLSAEGLPPTVPLRDSQTADLDQIATFSDRSRLLSGLANCWQFRCRAALPPRAPSSIS